MNEFDKARLRDILNMFNFATYEMDKKKDEGTEQKIKFIQFL